jgi:polysaccharide export outer membrane protein
MLALCSRSLVCSMAAWLLLAAGGCTAIVTRPDPRLVGAQTNEELGLSVPTEKDRTTLPTYTIEPPDILFIEAIRVVPKPPYKIQATDVVSIQMTGVLPTAPAGGGPAGDQYLVSPSGRVNLGPAYGDAGQVQIAGLTEDEAAEAIKKSLRAVVRDPQVWVELVQSAGMQPITGEHLVAPDGTVNLGSYGSVYVAGLTLEEATKAVNDHLSTQLDNPQVSMSVFAYNSKVYYVITEGAGLGDTVARFPITGNETVLDALSNVGGLTRVSSKRIWIARPMPAGAGCDAILPVDWKEITASAATASNYQILPGDRIFIAQDRLIALDSVMARVIAPMERIFGVSLLGTQTIQTINRLPLGFNSGSGF